MIIEKMNGSIASVTINVVAERRATDPERS